MKTPMADLRDQETAQERLLRLDPFVVEVGGWLRVSDVVRADEGWEQALIRHPELARLLALI